MIIISAIYEKSTNIFRNNSGRKQGNMHKRQNPLPKERVLPARISMQFSAPDQSFAASVGRSSSKCTPYQCPASPIVLRMQAAANSAAIPAAS